MKLYYRGVSSESTSRTAELVETGIIARFRGLTYQVCCPVNFPAPQFN